MNESAANALFLYAYCVVLWGSIAMVLYLDNRRSQRHANAGYIVAASVWPLAILWFSGQGIRHLATRRDP